MRKHASTATVGALCFLAMIFAVCVSGPVAAAGIDAKAYFSSGQAVIDSKNPADSRQQAIKNFMAQGLLQAIASFLDPDQMGVQLDKLRKSVLAGPEKYVDTYQIFSEKQIGAEFQVVGKVTVSMNLLKSDLEKLGMLGPQNAPAAPSSPPAPAARSRCAPSPE
jgi:hypothetical protein